MEMAAKSNVLRWFGHVLTAEKDNPVRMVVNFEVRGKRKKGHPKSTWKGKVKDSLQKPHLKEEDAFNCTKQRKCVWTFKNGVIPATSVEGDDTTRLKLKC